MISPQTIEDQARKLMHCTIDPYLALSMKGFNAQEQRLIVGRYFQLRASERTPKRGVLRQTSFLDEGTVVG